MRPWFLIFSIMLTLPLVGNAVAQGVSIQDTAGAKKAAEKAKSPPLMSSVDCRKSPDRIKACGEAWQRECVRDWDRSTHMTKQEFQRTCQRVVSERVKALIQESKATPAKATPARATRGKATTTMDKAK